MVIIGQDMDQSGIGQIFSAEGERDGILSPSLWRLDGRDNPTKKEIQDMADVLQQKFKSLSFDQINPLDLSPRGVLPSLTTISSILDKTKSLQTELQQTKEYNSFFKKRSEKLQKELRQAESRNLEVKKCSQKMELIIVQQKQQLFQLERQGQKEGQWLREEIRVEKMRYQLVAELMKKMEAGVERRREVVEDEYKREHTPIHTLDGWNQHVPQIDEREEDILSKKSDAKIQDLQLQKEQTNQTLARVINDLNRFVSQANIQNTTPVEKNSPQFHDLLRHNYSIILDTLLHPPTPSICAEQELLIEQYQLLVSQFKQSLNMSLHVIKRLLPSQDADLFSTPTHSFERVEEEQQTQHQEHLLDHNSKILMAQIASVCNNLKHNQSSPDPRLQTLQSYERIKQEFSQSVQQVWGRCVALLGKELCETRIEEIDVCKRDAQEREMYPQGVQQEKSGMDDS